MEIKDVRARLNCKQLYLVLGSLSPRTVPMFSTHNGKECLTFLTKHSQYISAVITFYSDGLFTECFAYTAADQNAFSSSNKKVEEVVQMLKALDVTEMRVSTTYTSKLPEAFDKFQQWACYMADAPR